MRKITMSITIMMIICFLSAAAFAESASQKEVMAKCMEAAMMVKEKGVDAAITKISDKKGPFVWKDTYVFLMDLDGKMLAHPIKPELTQKDNLLSVKDTADKPIFVEFVNVANKKGEGWVKYMWPKPGQEAPAAKSSYIYRVPGTQYLVGAGIYQ